MIERREPSPEEIEATQNGFRILGLLRGRLNQLGPHADLGARALDEAAARMDVFQFERTDKDGPSVFHLFVSNPLIPHPSRDEVMFSADLPALTLPGILIFTYKISEEGTLTETEIRLHEGTSAADKLTMVFWQVSAPKDKTIPMEETEVEIIDAGDPVLLHRGKTTGDRVPREKAFEDFVWPY